MMIVQSKRCGQIVTKREDVIVFDRGLFIDREKKNFVLVENKPSDLIMYLQSVEDPTFSFAVLDGSHLQHLAPSYSVGVTPGTLERLGLRLKDLRVLVVCNVDETRKVSLNLRVPIVLNPKTRKAEQVLMGEAIPTRFQLPIVASHSGQ